MTNTIIDNNVNPLRQGLCYLNISSEDIFNTLVKNLKNRNSFELIYPYSLPQSLYMVLNDYFVGINVRCNYKNYPGSKQKIEFISTGSN